MSSRAAILFKAHPRITAGVLAVLVVAGSFIGGRVSAEGSQGTTRLRVVSADEANRAMREYDVADRYELWATAGDGVDDHTLGDAALRAYAGGQPSDRLRQVFGATGDIPFWSRSRHLQGTLLYSGAAGPAGHRAALVETENSVLLARAPSGDSSDPEVKAAPVPETLTGRTGGPPINLSWDDAAEGNRAALAVPQWLTGLKSAGFAGEAAASWKPVRVKDGLADIPRFTLSTERDGTVAKCSSGTLLRADEALTNGKRQPATYLYSPGWPYAVRLTYRGPDTTMQSVLLPGIERAMPPSPDVLHSPGLMQAVRGLLCDRVVPRYSTPIDVVWRKLGPQGDAAMGDDDAPDAEDSVLIEDVSFVSYSTHYPYLKHRAIETSPKKATAGKPPPGKATPLDTRTRDVNTQLKSLDGLATDVACVAHGDQLTVLGPRDAKQIHLLDSGNGHTWSAKGTELKVPLDQLSQSKWAVLSATALTDNQLNPVFGATCVAPAPASTADSHSDSPTDPGSGSGSGKG